MKRKALITGINGQDGSYLAEYLISLNYEIYGTVRSIKSSLFNLRYLNIYNDLTIFTGDLRNIEFVKSVFNNNKYDEVYHLASLSSVNDSILNPEKTIHNNVFSFKNIIEILKNKNGDAKIFNASSSEIFSPNQPRPYSEDSVISPKNPYGVSKQFTHKLVSMYREKYGLHISNGILFSHDSYLRKKSFFIKKVVSSAVSILHGDLEKLELGNISFIRDYGYAPLFVQAMHLMVNTKIPDDFIISTGEGVLLSDIVNYVFDKLAIPRSKYVVTEKFNRPNENSIIIGDNTKITRNLNWKYDMNYRVMLDLIIDEELKNYNNSKL